jgi:hypothetical protein
VGTAFNSKTSETHAFMLSVGAVPEPETYALMLAGLAAVGFRARGQKRRNG